MYFQPKVIYADPTEARVHSIIRYIGNRVLRNNKNFLCALVGQTGAGKSWAGLKICELYSEMFGIRFDPAVHVISSLKELLLLINDKDVNHKIQFGSIILFDEPQTEANSRNWQSEANQALNQLTSTFRNQRLIVLFATPYLEFIDKQSRILFHGEFKVLGYDKNTKITKVKPRFLEWSHAKEDFYRKRLIIEYSVEGKEVRNIKKLNFWHLEKASDVTINVYEDKKRKFSEELNRRLLKSIELKEQAVQSRDKNEDLLKVKGLYEQFGEDYIKISSEMPHISPLSLEKLVQLIKRTNKRKRMDTASI